ncbi:hypothetical protein AXG93_3507s1230 [Marchantia polymorpha subsp. ruderalis]|uniref:Sfi1 spindle body domain-containing protein n=1 Tax=Marchantia polymorpha subsp. ruderalis TaxID=1480154 RepID=A0A176VG10_MARPO|nr:hypothetical protein AXG93_3507s1230 [Marchantia polymorpha subsp. ruderalis]
MGRVQDCSVKSSAIASSLTEEELRIAQTAVSIDEWPERISTTFVDLWERPTSGIELRSSISTSQSIKRKKRFADYQERQIESLGHDPSKPTVGLARSENERLDGEEGTMECNQTPTTRECQPNSFLDEPSIPCTHPERIRLRGPFCPIAQLPNCHDVVRDSQETVMFTCRAHRHHRKRLARIVADQWLYVARYRLITLRFRRQHGERLKRALGSETDDEKSTHCLDGFSPATCKKDGTDCTSCKFASGKIETRAAAESEGVLDVPVVEKASTEMVSLHASKALFQGIAAKSRSDLERPPTQVDTASVEASSYTLGAGQPSSRRPDVNQMVLALELVEGKINDPREKKLILAQRHYERKMLRAVYDRWERARFSSALARELAQHSLEASHTELAVSWFVKALVKRFLLSWKEQAAVQRISRRNHWHAVVHFKMQSVAKGLRGLRENVELEYFKESLQRLSIKSYQESLKRKAVTGCKLLHQSKRLKSAQLEHATAQWKTAKLQERFDKWYFATALRSMKKNQLLKSVNFSCRQLCLRGFRAWREVRNLSIKVKSLKEARLIRLRESLGKLKKMHVLRAWKSLRKVMNISRFNEARAIQFFLGFKAAAVVKALHVHMQEQKLKRSLLAKATQFQETKCLQRAVSTWNEYVFLRQLGRLAADHRRRRQLKHSLHILAQWKDPQPEFKKTQQQQQFEKTQQDNTLRESLNMYRRLRDLENPQRIAQPDSPFMRAVSSSRAQPRRPAFLYDDVDQTRTPVLVPKGGNERNNSGNESSKYLSLVAREVEWMEQILLDYEDIKVQIVKLRAELAVLLETRTSGDVNNFDSKEKIKMMQNPKILLLQQEIHSLEAKKMVQMPLIQAVLSRVQDLRTKRAPK